MLLRRYHKNKKQEQTSAEVEKKQPKTVPKATVKKAIKKDDA